MAHLPSGKFAANGAWLALAVITHNPARAFAALAGCVHRREQLGTIRRKLIQIPARVASSARRLRLHGWRWRVGFNNVTVAVQAVAQKASKKSTKLVLQT